MENLRVEILALKEETTKLQTDHEKQSGGILRLTSQNSELQNENSKLKKQLENVTSELEKTRKELTASKTATINAENTIKEFLSRCSGLEASFAQLEKYKRQNPELHEEPESLRKNRQTELLPEDSSGIDSIRIENVISLRNQEERDGNEEPASKRAKSIVIKLL